MVKPVPPQLYPVAKGAEKGQAAMKALTGDIYSRSWTDVRGKGKKRRTVQHEVHVNPLMLFAAAAVGVGAVALGTIGLWMTQNKVEKTLGVGKTRYARLYAAVYKTVTVVDQAAYIDYHQVPYSGPPYYDPFLKQWIQEGGWVTAPEEHPAVTHQAQQLDRAARCVVYTNRMIPLRTTTTELVEAIPWLSKHEQDIGWAVTGVTLTRTGTDTLGSYSEYKVTLANATKGKYGVTERAGLLS